MLNKEEKSKTKLSIKEILSISGLFLIWRLILQLIAFLGKNRLSLNEDLGYGKIISWEAPVIDFFKYWIKWDSGFYLEIAQKGYFFNEAKNLSNVTFFPLYPLLIKGLGFIAGDFYASIIIATIAALMACFYLYKLAKHDLQEKDSALRSVFYLLIFPTSLFLISAYTESLFLMLSIASFYYARRKKWWLASIFGFFTTFSRPQGIILFPILLLEYLEQREFKLKKIRLNILWNLITPLGLFVYMYYLKIKFGNPLLFISAQNAWGRDTTSFSIKSIWDTLSKYFYDFFFPGQENFVLYLVRDLDLIFFLSFLILSIIIFFQLRMSYGFYIVLSLLIPLLTGTLMSINRYVIALFPIYIYLTKISKNQIVQYGIILLFSSLFVIYTILFTNWYWAG